MDSHTMESRAVAIGQSRGAPAALIIERLLRDRDEVWQQIRSETDINALNRDMLLTAAVALAGYGAIMGIFYGVEQLLSSAIKLPLLFLLTLAICLPTLYYFNLLNGGRLSARQVLALALAGITVTACITLAFAPISIFFLITARDYNFFKLLNVGILALTGLIGVRFLVNGMGKMNEPEPSAAFTSPLLAPPDGDDATPASPPPARPKAAPAATMPLLWVWLLLFGFVGTQLGWTLRPFFGSPGLPFQVFRPLEGNFYSHLGQLLIALLR